MPLRTFHIFCIHAVIQNILKRNTGHLLRENIHLHGLLAVKVTKVKSNQAILWLETKTFKTVKNTMNTICNCNVAIFKTRMIEKSDTLMCMQSCRYACFKSSSSRCSML